MQIQAEQAIIQATLVHVAQGPMEDRTWQWRQIQRLISYCKSEHTYCICSDFNAPGCCRRIRCCSMTMTYWLSCSCVPCAYRSLTVTLPPSAVSRRIVHCYTPIRALCVYTVAFHSDAKQLWSCAAVVTDAPGTDPLPALSSPLLWPLALLRTAFVSLHCALSIHHSFVLCVIHVALHYIAFTASLALLCV